MVVAVVSVVVIAGDSAALGGPEHRAYGDHRLRPAQPAHGRLQHVRRHHYPTGVDALYVARSLLPASVQDRKLTGFADKEVQGYYDEGMRVPDDVILMWTDDKYVYMRY